MVDYNWCIGCRYCMAACPYGARHFNWAEPTVSSEEINPDTHYLGNRPRPKGVVEKCTFCIQRIHKGTDQAKSEGRDVLDGEVMPACAQACPADAIVFGRLDDPESQVSKLQKDNRAVHLLEELGTQPRVSYLMGGSNGNLG